MCKEAAEMLGIEKGRGNTCMVEKHRILIEVDGGVANWIADPGVEVSLIDYDDEKDGHSYAKILPPGWKDLVPHLDDKYFGDDDGT